MYTPLENYSHPHGGYVVITNDNDNKKEASVYQYKDHIKSSFQDQRMIY